MFKKKNHHYVPQYWQRAFADSSGQLYGKTSDGIKAVSTRRSMQEDYLYTTFSVHWDPSDDFENALAAAEAEDAKLLNGLQSIQHPLTGVERDGICQFIALQACRHPDVLRRGRRQAESLGHLIASVHDLPEADFAAQMTQLGVPPGVMPEILSG